jgi:hypothetical protein
VNLISEEITCSVKIEEEGKESEKRESVQKGVLSLFSVESR